MFKLAFVVDISVVNTSICSITEYPLVVLIIGLVDVEPEIMKMWYEYKYHRRILDKI